MKSKTRTTFQAMGEDFLSRDTFAVVGISTNKENPAGVNCELLKKLGKTVFPVNPRREEYQGEPCYKSLRDLPAVPDVVLIFTRADRSADIIRDCIAIGAERVWMHCALGTSPRFGRAMARKIGSASPEAVQLCHENGIQVLPGGCPMMIKGDGGHKGMAKFLKWMGALKIEE